MFIIHVMYMTLLHKCTNIHEKSNFAGAQEIIIIKYWRV